MTYSVRSDRPFEPGAIDVLRVVDSVMAKHQRQYIVVGATARDILLTHVFGLKQSADSGPGHRHRREGLGRARRDPHHPD